MIKAELSGVLTIQVNRGEVAVLNPTPVVMREVLGKMIEHARQTVNTSPSIADGDMQLVKEIADVSGLKTIKILQATEPDFDINAIY
jgi:NACalpha-BTF3-like transcription factor